MKRFPELLLVIVTAIWGGTFLASRIALEGTGPFTLLFVRFAIGAVLVGAFVRQRPSAREIQGALMVAVAMTVAIGAQNIGLRTVESGRAAFLTALYVPLVPLFQGRLLGQRPNGATIAGAAIAFLGLAALSSDGGLSFRFGVGEALMVVGAIASAVQILLVGRFASGGNASALTAMQLVGVSALALSGAATEGMHATPLALALAAGLGVFGTAGALWAMNWAQRTVSPSRATLIYALEPVWAALFGALAGERLGPLGAVGGGLVVAGALVGQMNFRRAAVVA